MKGNLSNFFLEDSTPYNSMFVILFKDDLQHVEMDIISNVKTLCRTLHEKNLIIRWRAMQESVIGK